MRFHNSGRFTFALLLVGFAIGISPALAEDTSVAVSARVEHGYARQRLANGDFRPETFAFGKGGPWGGPARDASIDGISFIRVAEAIAPALRDRKYVPCADPRKTGLLIMVYWGATRPPQDARSSVAMQRLQMATAQMASASIGANVVRFDIGAEGWARPQVNRLSVNPTSNISTPAQAAADAAMTGAMAMVAAENRSRDQLDAQNASILGYDSSFEQSREWAGTPFEYRRTELADELEDSRYFVVLMAYDFQTMWKQKQAKLLWETRYSIRSRGHDFREDLAAMTRSASSYFGGDTAGLRHRPLPEGRVDVGTARVVDYSPGSR